MNSNATIKCRNCGEEIEISEALRHQIEEQVVQNLNAKHKIELEKVENEAFAKAQKELSEKNALELEDLKKQLEEKNKKVEELRSQEMELRKKSRELEEKEKEMALDMERKMDEERKKLEEKILKDESEKQRFKNAEYEKRINDLKNALEDAQRKASQGSQQLQGEVLELDLEAMLRGAFPTDMIEPVEKGVRGADVRQTVRTARGNTCGVILWETKRTKAWQDSWLVKLKDDLRNEKANIPVIVSSVLPPEAKNGFGLKDGVWLVSFPLVLQIAEILRSKLYDVARERHAQQSKDGKAGSLYTYITSHEFRQEIEVVVEQYNEMKMQIEKERRAYERMWSSREVQVEKIFKSTARMVGSIQGVVGNSMVQIKGLELLELEDGNVE